MATKRAQVKGSPVTPKSAIKIKSDNEFVMYSILCLKGQFEAAVLNPDNTTFTESKYIDYIEPLKAAFRDKRYVIREFSYDASKAGTLDVNIDKAKSDLQQTITTLTRWCKAHFGELYSGWIHLKVIRSFVESVLRYGLPPDFLGFFVEITPKQEKVAITTLTHAISKLLDPNHEHNSKKKKNEEEDEEEDATEAENLDNLLFVCQSFPAIGWAAPK